MRKNNTNGRRHTKHPFQLKPAYAVVLLAFTVQTVEANPLDPTVVSGQASFATSGSTLTVTNTPGTIINWQGFSIGANEITRFNQQSASSAVLNRVISSNPSSILGTLQSNGRVFLINPNGIVFGAGAVVDVAGLVASTLNLSDDDFLAGNHHYTEIPGAANISNAGGITAQSGGQIFLIAPDVENTGVITAPNGEILLAAGYSVDLVSTSDPDLRVSITAPAGDATNVGKLIAESGSLGLFGTVVRNSGAVSADSATMQGGKIIFRASQRAEISGAVSATGVAGGDIQILGNQVALIGNAGVDASGNNGGGTVLIGGDAHGANPAVQNAQQTFVSSDATIKADAVQNGDGGKVVVWADGATQFRGNISAQGGVDGGDGGWVEVSGKQWLVYAGLVDTRAAHGLTGSLLLDPTDITISLAADTVSMTWTAGTLSYADTVATPSNLNVTTLQTQLGLSNVTVDTTSALAGTGNITVQDSIVWNSANSLTLNAAGTGTITVNALNTLGAPLQIANSGIGALSLISATNIIVSGDLVTTGGNVLLNANTAGAGGAIVMNSGSSIISNGGNVTFGGGIAGNGTGNAVGNATYASGIDILGASINSGAGNITLNGLGDGLGSLNMGVYLHTGASLTTTTGNVTINGTGGGMTDMTAGSNRGVRISSASAITTGTGNIGITGQGGWDTDGVQVVGGAQVKSTTGGQITLTGTTGLGTGLNYGIYLSDAGTLVETSGNILFTGVSNSVAGTDNKGIALYETNLGIPLTDGPVVRALGIGNITFNGTGGGGTTFSSGMTISGSEVTVADGTITLNGTSGTATGTENRGVNLHTGAWVHATGLGNIIMTGVAVNSATASLGSGVRVATGAIVQTASGAINITGSGTNGTDSNYGVLITDALSAVKSASGTVSITGSGWGTGINNYGVYVVAGGIVDTNVTATLLANSGIYIDSALTNTTGGSLVLNADMNGAGAGTVTFGAGGSIARSGGGRADLYYNPVSYADAATKSDALTSPYTTKITGPYTAWMLVNNVGLETGGTLGLQAMSTNLTGNYALGKDIDATGTATWNLSAGFAPVGTLGTYFTGRFDGRGHIINGLFINRSTSFVGLFGATQASTIKNVTLTNANVTGGSDVGGLAGWHQGSLTNSHILSGTVTGTSNFGYAGGLVGINYNYSTIDNCSAGSAVSGINYVGGLVGGSQQSTISNSSASGTVTGTQFYVGGLAGSMEGGSISASNLTNGTATGNVVGGSYVGGLVGWSGYRSNITNGIASGTVSGNNDVGGLVGFNAYNIASSHATGSVTGLSKVGGLVGNNGWDSSPAWASSYGAVSNSYANTGTVTGTSNVGGMVGYNYFGTISISNAGGAVTGNSNVGGLVGYNDRGSISIAYATGTVTGNGVGNNSLGGLVGYNDGTITDSYVTSVSVTGVNNIGGLVGNNALFAGYANSIIGSYVSGGSVTGTGANVGGLVGNNTGTINNSHYNITGVTVNGANIVTLGGLYNDNTANLQLIGQYDDWLIGKSLNIADYTSLTNTAINSYTLGTTNGIKDLLGFADNPLYTFTLTGSINLTGMAGFYVPILASSFDGANFTVSNLSLNISTSNLGFFGKISGTSTVSNMVLENASVIGGSGNNVGALAGSNQGAIINSSVRTSIGGSATVSGADSVGGLVGNNTSSITSGSVDGSVGTVTVTGVNSVGGLAGTNSSSIITSFAKGATVAGANNIGGLVGNNAYLGSISDSYVSSGAVSATVHNVGGLIGFESGGMRNNSYFNIDAVTTNGGNNVTAGGLYNTAGTGQFNDWLNVGTPLTPLVIGDYSASLVLQLDGSYGIGNMQGMKDMLGFAGDPVAYNFSLTATNINLDPGYYVPNLAGSFNGKSSTLSNLSLTLPNDDMGLFGVTSTTSVVSNLNLVNVSVNGYGNVGGLVASNFGNIDNVTVGVGTSGIRAVTGKVGGLVGQNNGGSFTTSGAPTSGIISNSIVTGGTVTGSSGDVGGLVGYNNQGNISASHVDNTAVSGTSNVGGLVGYNLNATCTWCTVYPRGMITNSYVTNGTVTSTGGGLDKAIGGLVGLNLGGDISGSHSLNSTVSGGSASWVGGLVGRNDGGVRSVYQGTATGFVKVYYGTIINSYVSGGTVSSNGNEVGGLVGHNHAASIDLSHVDTVSVTGVTNVGGLVGYDSGEGYGGGFGIISNSHALNTQVTGESSVGGLVGMVAAPTIFSSSDNFDAVMNSYVSGGTVTSSATTTSAAAIGGLVGYNSYGNISNSYVTSGTVVNGGLASDVGGLVGHNIGSGTAANRHGLISGSYVNGGIVSGNRNVGGLVGNNAKFGLFDWGFISNSYVSGATVRGMLDVGGLVGNNAGEVTNSYAAAVSVGLTTTVTSATNIGGLAGTNSGNISNSYVSGGTVGASTTAGYFAVAVGGLVGSNSGTISNTYVTGGTVTGYFNVAGLVGVNTLTGSINTSYVASGLVTDCCNSAFGLVDSNAGSVQNSFWDTQTTGIPTNGVGGSPGTNVVGLLTVDMMKMASFTGGWNIANTGGTTGMTWRIYEGQTNPLLMSFLAPLTVTANTGSRTYDGTTNGLGVTYSTPPDANLLGAVVAQTANPNVGSYTVTPSGLYSTQMGYDISYVNGTLTVTPTTLTVTANAASKTYDGLAFSGGSGVTYTGLVNGETSAVLGGTLAYGGNSQGAINAGSYLITPGGYTSGNYTISYVDGVLTISPASVTLSITASDTSKTYGTTLTFSGTEFLPVTGLQGSDAIGSVTLTSLGAVSTANAGTYAITPSNAVFSVGSASNYTLTYVDGVLTVTPASITIAADAATKVYGDADPALTYTVAGMASFDTTATVFTGALARAAGEEVATGPYAINRGNLAANANYTVTGFTGNVLSITPAPLTVTVNDANKILNTPDPLLTYMVAGLKLSDTEAATLSGELSRAAGETVGIYPINQGTLALTSTNYTMTYVPGRFTILVPTVIDEIVNTSLLFSPDTGSSRSTSSSEEDRVTEEVVVVADTTTAEDTAAPPLPVCPM